MLKPNTYGANPDMYDYLHYFILGEDNSFEFCIGGGQSINLEGKGSYWINKLLNEEFGYELLLIDVKFNKAFRNYDFDFTVFEGSKKVKFNFENGNFAFIGNNPWIDEKSEQKLRIYKGCVTFETDPLFFFEEQYDNTPFGRSTYRSSFRKDLIESERKYYCDKFETTVGEAVRSGKIPGLGCNDK